MNLLTGVKKSRVFTGAEKTKGAVGDKLLQRVAVETQVAALTEDDDVDQARSLFVKNLNFSTTEVSLKKHFDQKITQGSVRSVTVRFYLIKFLVQTLLCCQMWFCFMKEEFNCCNFIKERIFS